MVLFCLLCMLIYVQPCQCNLLHYSPLFKHVFIVDSCANIYLNTEHVHFSISHQRTKGNKRSTIYASSPNFLFYKILKLIRFFHIIHIHIVVINHIESEKLQLHHFIQRLAPNLSFLFHPLDSITRICHNIDRSVIIKIQ